MKKIHHYIVVDDDAINNMICDFTIKKYDSKAKINLFTIPEAGLSYIKKEYGKEQKVLPTVLFLDVNMPTMTGWEFLDVFSTFDDAIKEQFMIFILSSSIEDFTEKLKVYPILEKILSKPLKLEHLKAIN